jgi:precorrin-6B methylase 2
MDLLEIRSGSAVVDIGAGPGWFNVRAARLD